jgi:hypothetical protein
MWLIAVKTTNHQIIKITRPVHRQHAPLYSEIKSRKGGVIQQSAWQNYLSLIAVKDLKLIANV